LLYFGLPALLFVIGFWVAMPWFIGLGMLSYYAYLLALGIPLALLLVASILWLWLEGRDITWTTVKSRFRLHGMSRKAWLWSLGALIAGSLIGTALFGYLSRFLVDLGVIPIPSTIPAFMSPTAVTDPMAAYDRAVGGLRGNWIPFFANVVLLFFNVLGEELWWRGVVLPRQELVFGEHVWIVHGMMWAVFHIFKWWDVLMLVPICLALAFVCSRLKNTTPGIVIHGVTNGISLVPLLMAILG
jgi:membrane protease YdiL (CAAX protease family)